MYLGRDTKLSLNQQRPRTKFSRLETLMNWTVIGMSVPLPSARPTDRRLSFIVQQLICILLAVGTAVWRVRRCTHLQCTHLDCHRLQTLTSGATHGTLVRLSMRSARWRSGPIWLTCAHQAAALIELTCPSILLNIFIPISLWITMEIVKFIQAYFIEKDEAMTVPASVCNLQACCARF